MSRTDTNAKKKLSPLTYALFVVGYLIAIMLIMNGLFGSPLTPLYIAIGVIIIVSLQLVERQLKKP